MEAMQFDSENKNSKWYDAIELEMESMAEYKVFKSGIKQSLINIRKSQTLLKVIIGSKFIYYLLSSLMAHIKLDWWLMATLPLSLLKTSILV